MSKPPAPTGFFARIQRVVFSAFSDELLPSRRRYDTDHLERQIARGRRAAYRYMLLAMAVMLAPIDAHNFYSGQYVPAIAGLVVLLLFVWNVYLLSQERDPFLSPPTVLVLALLLVVLSLAYGQSYNLYWIYPLLVALPVLLKTRVAVWLGILVGVMVMPFILMRFDTNTALIVCLSMVHTWLFSAGLMFAMTQQSRRLNQLAITDPLTGAFNRRYLQIEAKSAFQNFQRRQIPSTLLLLDVDFFKQVNDVHGHEAGDEALCGLVRMLTARLRSQDTVFRYGGEEFVALLKETDESGAIQVAEEVRSIIESTELVAGAHITVSIGVCDVIQAESVSHWLNLCDRALYQAKAEGRNRVVIATPGDMMSPMASMV